MSNKFYDLNELKPTQWEPTIKEVNTYLLSEPTDWIMNEGETII